jgi:hypothetical protein
MNTDISIEFIKENCKTIGDLQRLESQIILTTSGERGGSKTRSNNCLDAGGKSKANSNFQSSPCFILTKSSTNKSTGSKRL